MVLKHTSVSVVMSNAKAVKLFPIFILIFLLNNQVSSHFPQCLLDVKQHTFLVQVK